MGNEASSAQGGGGTVQTQYMYMQGGSTKREDIMELLSRADHQSVNISPQVVMNGELNQGLEDAALTQKEAETKAKQKDLDLPLEEEKPVEAEPEEEEDADLLPVDKKPLRDSGPIPPEGEGRILNRWLDYENRRIVGERLIDRYHVQRELENTKVDEYVLDIIEQEVEVPEIIVKERIIHNPRIEFQERRVEVPVVKVKEEIREIPRVTTIEEVIEIEEEEVTEHVVKMPKYEYRERPVFVPGPVEVTVKIVEVPHVEYREVLAEPELQLVSSGPAKEVIIEKEVEVPLVEYRKVDVEQVFERPVPVDKVVEVPYPVYQDIWHVTPHFVGVPFEVKREVPYPVTTAVPYVIPVHQEHGGELEPSMSVGGIFGNWRPSLETGDPTTTQLAQPPDPRGIPTSLALRPQEMAVKPAYTINVQPEEGQGAGPTSPPLLASAMAGGTGAAPSPGGDREGGREVQEGVAHPYNQRPRVVEEKSTLAAPKVPEPNQAEVSLWDDLAGFFSGGGEVGEPDEEDEEFNLTF
uniref:Uncharacterized protein n=1 Tax=Chromera velia CCMP2878 TaxID=1169474 RepID=A0A0G4HSU4_9ALVE|mmetsp:Transcript_28991/g.56753  ORF Transcript_28991/g.56753 Transcript_28991/m.56753 type:complete len:523 (-) Transcript_28991:528-2096(-)|eukprot:Cvel_1331.t1-p1 / transcript=Cvel_1331.t1 / gene=Cvel_1331 / organism=Chromera_velia_CCMP2878 / gene_product=hypothetical protein / transcript_product=hypothetical protein / location=Cvel_scaffold45:110278-117268(-) / protein_length=522 / sequence_SO=supercontig / SO=protein_coding / is_pseudo=false